VANIRRTPGESSVSCISSSKSAGNWPALVGEGNVSVTPKLRYITVAFRSSFDEIPKLVEHSHTHWLSTENEIRYTYNVAHIEDEFRREHYLRKDDWPVLTERLAQLPYQYVIAYPPEEGYEDRKRAMKKRSCHQRTILRFKRQFN
jgi:hypothetical protein